MQRLCFVTLNDGLKNRIEELFPVADLPITLYRDPRIKTITTIPCLFHRCVILLIRQANVKHGLNNYIELAFYHDPQGIYFVPMDRQDIFESAPFEELYKNLENLKIHNHPHFYIIQSLKALKKAGGRLQILKLGKTREYPSFRFNY